MKVDSLIARSLWAGGVLLVVLAVAGGLWGGLHALRDAAGAGVMRGIVLVAFVCWCLNFVALVVLLAVARLSSAEEPPDRRDE